MKELESHNPTRSQYESKIVRYLCENPRLSGVLTVWVWVLPEELYVLYTTCKQAGRYLKNKLSVEILKERRDA